MKRKLNIQSLAGLLALTTLFFIYGCMTSIDGKGPIATESRNTGQFTELTVDIPANITLVISSSPQCIISAQKNIIDIIETKRSGDKLRISSERGYNSDKPVEITIATSSIESISLNGSAMLEGLNPVKGDDLELSLNGSGHIKLNAQVNDLKSQLNGSGDLFLSGKTSDQEIEINGSGNVKAYELSADKCKITINGSGNAEVTAGSELNAKLRGSGTIEYKGAPSVKSEITGSGSVSKSN